MLTVALAGLAGCAGDGYAWDAEIAGHWHIAFETNCPVGSVRELEFDITPFIDDVPGPDGEPSQWVRVDFDDSFDDGDCGTAFVTSHDVHIQCSLSDPEAEGLYLIPAVAEDGAPSAEVNLWYLGSCSLSGVQATVVSHDR